MEASKTVFHQVYTVQVNIPPSLTRQIIPDQLSGSKTDRKTGTGKRKGGINRGKPTRVTCAPSKAISSSDEYPNDPNDFDEFFQPSLSQFKGGVSPKKG